MSKTAKDTIGLLGYGAAALLLSVFNSGSGVTAGILIMLATVVFHLVANRCPHCGKFQGFVGFGKQCRRCGKEL